MRLEAGAEAVIVIVLGGAAGDGFSVQAPLPIQLQLPGLLEATARQIRATLAGGEL